jgi:hypothetical protein
MSSGTPEVPVRRVNDGTAVEVSYRLTRDDYAAWWARYFDRSAGRNTPRYASALIRLALLMIHATLGVGIATLVFLCLFVARRGEKVVAALGSTAGILVIFQVLLLIGVGRNSLGRRLARRWHVKKADRAFQGLVGLNRTLRVSLLPEGLVETTRTRRPEPGITQEEHSEATIAWEVVRQIDVGGERVFFILEPGNRAIIVPRSAFPDDTAFDHFLATAQAYRNGTFFAPGAGRSVVQSANEHITAPTGPSEIRETSP